jgi:hypothetical protein
MEERGSDGSDVVTLCIEVDSRLIVPEQYCEEQKKD